MTIDLRIAQLMSSRLCHDLVGTVGAINAGLEMAAEQEQGQGQGDALELAGVSAGEVERRLAFYRVAFGLGSGAKEGRHAEEARALASGLMQGGRVVLDWPADELPDTLSATAAKLLLNMILVGQESLPRGGTLSVRFAAMPEGLGMALTGRGDGAAMRAETRDALDLAAPSDALSARGIHGRLAAVLAEDLGGALEADELREDGEIRLAALIP